MTGGVEAEGSPEPLSREPTSSQQDKDAVSGSDVKSDNNRLRASSALDKNSGESVNEGEEGQGQTQVRSRRRTEGGGSVTSSSPMPLGDEDAGKVWLTEEEMGNVSREELLATYRRLQVYFEQVKRKGDDELNQAKESEEKHRSELVEVSRRHKALLMRLTTRERQLNETEAQMNELRKSITPNVGALRSTLLDPAVNLIISKMRKEFEETKKKLEDTQNDLNAWKFTPDSNTGKRLMSKCRMLYQENEELGKMISSGRLAKLESDLALQKSLTLEMKKSQSELDELVQELDEDVEGMQSTICFLQKQLRDTNKGFSTGPASDSSPLPPTPSSNSNSCVDTASQLVSVTLSDLCAQCRTLALTPTKPVPDDTKLRTKPPSVGRSEGEYEEGMELDVDESEEERLLIVDERTTVVVNGELGSSVHHSSSSSSPLNHSRTSKSTSNSNANCLSVQNVVNSTVSNDDSFDEDDDAEESELWNKKQQSRLQHLSVTDQTDGGPPNSKRTKLLEVSTTSPSLVTKSSECPSPSTVNGNGNGSLEH